jgi:hypothetical protein
MATPATKTPSSRSSRSIKTPLSEVEFESASDVVRYGDVMRKLGRTEQLELHTAADELQAVLANSTGSVFDRAASRRKARKIANRLRKAADSARAIAVEGVRLQRDFRREYAALIDPPKKSKGKSINWKG